MLSKYHNENENEKENKNDSLESNLCDYSDAYILAISFYKIWTISCYFLLL